MHTEGLSQSHLDLLTDLSALGINWMVFEDVNTSSIETLLQHIEKHFGKRGGDQPLSDYIKFITDILWSLDQNMASLYGHRVMDYLTDLENRREFLLNQFAPDHMIDPKQSSSRSLTPPASPFPVACPSAPVRSSVKRETSICGGITGYAFGCVCPGKPCPG